MLQISLPAGGGCPNPPGVAVVPNGFLLAASSLGLPPRPLKNPPPVAEPAVFAELEPNRLPPDGCCCKRDALVLQSIHKNGNFYCLI